MNEYLSLANFILPEGMLDLFNLKDVRTTSANGQATIHIYLDENEKTPDGRTDLRPNGFTRERTFHDFSIRGQEVLLHVRRHRWLDTGEHNVMTECDFVQESTRCSKITYSLQNHFCIHSSPNKVILLCEYQSQ